MSMTHKLPPLVTVCLTVDNYRKLFLYTGPTGGFVHRMQGTWCHGGWLCSSSVPNFTLSFTKPKSIAALLTWRSAISCEHSWLRERHYWFSFLFFMRLPKPKWPYSWGKKKDGGEKHQRLHTKDIVHNLTWVIMTDLWKKKAGFIILAAFSLWVGLAERCSLVMWVGEVMITNTHPFASAQFIFNMGVCSVQEKPCMNKCRYFRAGHERSLSGLTRWQWCDSYAIAFTVTGCQHDSTPVGDFGVTDSTPPKHPTKDIPLRRLHLSSTYIVAEDEVKRPLCWFNEFLKVTQKSPQKFWYQWSIWRKHALKHLQSTLINETHLLWMWMFMWKYELNVKQLFSR